MLGGGGILVMGWGGGGGGEGVVKNNWLVNFFYVAFVASCVCAS